LKTRIRELREYHGLTQKAVASYLLCDQSLYAKYELEKREIPLYLIVKLALYYQTSVDYLVCLTDHSAPYERRK